MPDQDEMLRSLSVLPISGTCAPADAAETERISDKDLY